MNLQDIKDKFETKTVTGREVEILAYKEGQERPIFGIRKNNHGWASESWRDNGLSFSSDRDNDLISKKKHLPKDILCEVSSEWESDKLRYSDGEGGFF